MEAEPGPDGVRRYETSLAEVCARLNHHRARYVLVGASALQLWGSTRGVLAGLGETGFGFAKEWLAEEVAKRPVTIIGDSPRVDILTVASSVHYREASKEATVFTVETVKIPTASIDHLIASKRTGRLQDAADIEVLEEIKRLRGGEAR